MENKNKWIVALLAMFTIIVVIICIFSVNNYLNEDKKEVKTDFNEFQEIYEGLNGEYSEERETHYLDVELNENLKVEILEADKVIDVLENEDALVYFGFDDCPWCRNMLSTLSNAAVNNDMTLYYVDLLPIRNSFEVVNGEAVEKEKGSDEYYKMLEIFGDNLSSYSITVDEEEYETGYTRIFAPTIAVFSNGEVKDLLVGTHPDVTDPYTALTEEQDKELEDMFDDLIENIKSNVCVSDDVC